MCRECGNAYMREYQRANAEKRRDALRGYYATYRSKHPSELSERRKKDYWSDPQKHRERSRKTAQENPEANREKHRKFIANNRGKMVALAGERYAELQAKTLPQAARNGHEWAGWEFEVISDYSRTTEDLAIALGRTFGAVATMRAKLQKDPQTIARAGLSESPKNA